MSEATHHDASFNEEGFHEIQLSGKQLVFLFMATTVVAVLIFLCGVQVGRNVKTPDRPIESTDALATVTPPPAASVPSQPAASSGPPASEPPAPAQEPEDELSYAKRLQADTAPAEKLKTPAAAAPAPTPRTEAPAAAPAPRTAANAAPKRDLPPATAQSGARPGPWIVQLTALQDRGAASAIARRLSGRGYPAFVLDPAPGSPAIYRVQVGGYPDRAGAEQAARRLEKEEQFKAYVRAR